MKERYSVRTLLARQSTVSRFHRKKKKALQGNTSTIHFTVYKKIPQVKKSTHVYLESHVLQEEASSIVLLTLVATASTDPQSNLRQGKSSLISQTLL